MYVNIYIHICTYWTRRLVCSYQYHPFSAKLRIPATRPFTIKRKSLLRASEVNRMRLNSTIVIAVEQPTHTHTQTTGTGSLLYIQQIACLELVFELWTRLEHRHQNEICIHLMGHGHYFPDFKFCTCGVSYSTFTTNTGSWMRLVYGQTQIGLETRKENCIPEYRKAPHGKELQKKQQTNVDLLILSIPITFFHLFPFWSFGWFRGSSLISLFGKHPFWVHSLVLPGGNLWFFLVPKNKSSSSWRFQPIWQIFVKMGIFPK